MVAADIGKGGVGVFVDVSRWSVEKFWDRRREYNDREVTLRIEVPMPVAVKRFLDKQ